MTTEQPTPTSRRGLVEQEIYRHALALFDRQGYASTTLKDIAASMGTSRSSLYYYFDTKESILRELVHEVTERGATGLAAIADSPATPEEKLVEAATAIIRRRLEEPERFRVLDRCEDQLPEELGAIHQKSKRQVLRTLTGIIDDGIRAGVFKPQDPKIAALGILGMCNWVAWWYHPSAAQPDAVVEQLSRAALATIANGDAAGAEGSIQDLLGDIRDRVDRLERMVETP